MLSLGLGLWPRGNSLGFVPVPPSKALPGLVLDFAGNQAYQSGVLVPLSSTLAFTRAAQAWDSQPDGSLVSVASGSPRYGGGLGFLPEGARTNLLLQSGNFSTSWGNANSTITQAATTGVDNTASAVSALVNAAGGGPSQSVTIAAASTQTISTHAAPFATNWLRMRIAAGAEVKQAFFNLATGAIGVVDAPGVEITAISTSTKRAANGFYRCIATVTTATATTLNITFIPSSADNTNGAASDSCYLDKSQIEAGATCTSYITTTVATATRNADSMIITGAPFTAGLTAAEGTMFFEMEFDAATPSNTYAGGLANTASPVSTHRITPALGPTGISFAVVDTTVFQVSTPAVAGNTRPLKTRFAARYKLNDSNASTKGSVTASDTACTIPAGMDRLVIGSAPWAPGGAACEGRISRVAFWPTGLVNSDLQALSA